MILAPGLRSLRNLMTLVMDAVCSAKETSVTGATDKRIIHLAVIKPTTVTSIGCLTS